MNNLVKFLSILILYLLFSNLSYSNENLYRSSNIIMQNLINVLVQIKKPKSIEVARNLKSVGLQNKSYDLIIRKANLNIKNSLDIAKAIKQINQNNGP